MIFSTGSDISVLSMIYSLGPVNWKHRYLVLQLLEFSSSLVQLNVERKKKKKKKKMKIHEFHFLVYVCVFIFVTKTLHQRLKKKKLRRRNRCKYVISALLSTFPPHDVFHCTSDALPGSLISKGEWVSGILLNISFRPPIFFLCLGFC